jgi:ribosomal protein L40E
MTAITDTDCRKCGAAMRDLQPARGAAPINRVAFIVTAYRCKNCDHWNDLKKRKKNKKVST